MKWLRQAVLIGLITGCSATPSVTPTQVSPTTIAPASPSPTSAAATPSAEPSPAPTAQLRWAKLALALQAPAHVAVSTGPSPIYVAVTERGVVWRSQDGEAWRRVAELEFPRGDANAVNQLVFANGRFIAVGTLGSSAGSSAILVAYLALGSMVWVSSDGRSWDQAAPQGLGAEATVLDNVTVTANGLIATTTNYGEAPADVVTSADGRRWSTEAPMRDIGIQSIAATAILPDGTAALFGSGEAIEECSGFRIAEWLVGQRVLEPVAVDLGCGSFYDVVRGPMGFIALVHQVTDDQAAMAIATSRDGKQWTLSPSSFTQSAGLIGVTESGFYLAADETGIFESSDGVVWAPTIARAVSAYQFGSFAGGVLLVCDSTYGCDAYRLEA